MLILIIVTGILLIISFLFDRQKTFNALKIAFKKLIKIIIPVTIMLIFVSIILLFLTKETITKYLTGKNIYSGSLIASLLGSISLMPGFIAFPLSGILKQNGVSFMVISAFTSTLMMVGVITFPIEKLYFGFKIALLRNVISFIIALIVALITGILFGEIFL